MSKTQIVLATGEVYDVEDKGERRILIPVGYIKQEEEKHEQSDFNGTFNTGSAGEIHTGAVSYRKEGLKNISKQTGRNMTYGSATDL